MTKVESNCDSRVYDAVEALCEGEGLTEDEIMQIANDVQIDIELGIDYHQRKKKSRQTE